MLVPTYEYECEKCHRTFEVRQRISEPALTTHDECGGAVRRLLSAAPFILKGEGWYVTDYPSEARKKAREAEKSGGSSDKSGSSEKSGPEKSGSKSAGADTASSTPKTDSTSSSTTSTTTTAPSSKPAST